MNFPTKYIIETNEIKLNAYRLISFFYSNKEVSRTRNTNHVTSGIEELESNFFFKEVSRLLIQIAISIRVLDDQMKSLDSTSEVKIKYDEYIEEYDLNGCMLFDDLNLRQTCNKIIHADSVQLSFQELRDGNHEIDDHNYFVWSEEVELSGNTELPKPKPIKWEHLSNYVQLQGRWNNELWTCILDIESFVETISMIPEI